MFIRFIAHAGLYIEEGGYSVLIDPWFFDSTPEYPVIESIGGGFKTIDFQIPKTFEVIEKYVPDVILVSHFHPHHSPIKDITQLCKQSLAANKKVTVAYAVPHRGAEKHLEKNISKDVVRKAVLPYEKITVGPITIESREHTEPFHSAWLITSSSGSVLHIADGRMNKNTESREMDRVWKNLESMHPDFLFLGSGSHSNRRIDKDGVRDIDEAGICTPVEAAKIVACIKPRVTGLIGIYNSSIWRNRQEYILSTAFVEEMFEWALWLAPTVRYVRLRPGYTFGVGEPAIQKKCGLYLEK